MGKLLEEYEKRLKRKSDINEHLPVLKQYSSVCSHVTEFGVNSGNSSYGLLAGNPNTMISYDIVFCKVTDSISSACLEEGINYKFIIGDSNEIEIEPTDLLFIDTKHTYKQLLNELRRHSEKVNNYIIMHDVRTFAIRDEDGNVDGKTGLRAAINEFLQSSSGDLWRIDKFFLNNNGLLVLSKKNKPKISLDPK